MTSTSPSTVTGSATTPATTTTPEDFKAYINDNRFNRVFQLPADLSRGREKPLQVSYADFGYCRENNNEQDGEEKVLLFFGPLVSSRMFNAAKDEMAKRYKIRIVTSERPGIGKTDSVPAEKRLVISREAVVALLDHLAIKHVYIGCHSGGTVFALDFAVHHPQFLHPSMPYIAIGSPWVHPSHSGLRTLSLASSLPSSLVAQTGNLAAFVNSAFGPVLGVSAAMSSSASQLWTAPPPKGRVGTDVDFEDGMRSFSQKQLFSESVRGIGPEVQMLLRNGVEEAGWSDWTDYDTLAPRLAEAIRAVEGARLKLEVFFSEKDHMIGDAGNQGSNWFEACWKRVDGIDFLSQTVKGSDHDTVWDLRWDVMETAFQNMTR